MDVETYTRKIPKAELHLHLEGCATPAFFKRLSEKYGTEYRSLSESDIENQLFRYADFYQFLETYKILSQHLRQPQDYLHLLDWLVLYLEENRVRYAEVIWSPAIAWRFERSAEEILEALCARRAGIESETGIRINWILDCVRQFGVDSAWQTARLAEKFQPQGVVAVGLGGDENSGALTEFKAVFEWARAHGLFAHVHAGEIGGPEQVWEALQILGANRIGHGIQAARDPKLMEYLRDHAVGLDICLTSNLKTGVWAPVSENPFNLLYRRGVPVSLNTDDPGLFATTISAEYQLAARQFELSFSDLRRIALQGVHSSFLPSAQRSAMMQSFQDEIAKVGEPGA